jgi:hypothetical protein
MTKQEAKDTTVKVWEHLAEHPEIEYKTDLPDELWNKISGMVSTCPLCELFANDDCEGCPLDTAGERCDEEGSIFDRWVGTSESEYAARKSAASELVGIVAAWKTKKTLRQRKAIMSCATLLRSGAGQRTP